MTLKHSYEVDYTSLTLHKEKVAQNEILPVTLLLNNKRRLDSKGQLHPLQKAADATRSSLTNLLSPQEKRKKKNERLHTSISGV